MLAPRVMDEMKAADLKDKRLDSRLREVLSQLASHSVASIPAACGGHAETTAAYRFFDNEKVTFENVLQPHRVATLERLAAQAVYRVVRRESPPSQPPPLAEMVRLVAQLGGYINRSRKDPPGPQTVWIGLQRMHDFALCWDLLGPEAKTRRQLV